MRKVETKYVIQVHLPYCHSDMLVVYIDEINRLISIRGKYRMPQHLSEETAVVLWNSSMRTDEALETADDRSVFCQKVIPGRSLLMFSPVADETPVEIDIPFPQKVPKTASLRREVYCENGGLTILLPCARSVPPSASGFSPTAVGSLRSPAPAAAAASATHKPAVVPRLLPPGGHPAPAPMRSFPDMLAQTLAQAGNAGTLASLYAMGAFNPLGGLSGIMSQLPGMDPSFNARVHAAGAGVMPPIVPRPDGHVAPAAAASADIKNKPLTPTASELKGRSKTVSAKPRPVSAPAPAPAPAPASPRQFAASQALTTLAASAASKSGDKSDKDGQDGQDAQEDDATTDGQPASPTPRAPSPKTRAQKAAAANASTSS